MPFQPQINQELLIDGISYHIAEHPAAPGMPYGQEGRAAIVYQLVTPDGHKRALKVFKPRYRLPALVSLADSLAAFADLPGLQVCRRSVLTPQRHTDLLRQHPDLTYAVLMPWVEGPTWMEVMLEKRPLAPEQCLALARSLADILAAIEQHGLAHCDLSASNVMLPALVGAFGSPWPGGEGVALVDVEQLYGPGLRRPEWLTSASQGYAHRTASEGLWAANADRFAGAVLLAEMLGWCDPQVVEAAWGESYSAPEEMQAEVPRYRLLVGSLRRNWGEEMAALLERAWRSDTLADCATFGEWLISLPLEAPVLPQPVEKAEKVEILSSPDPVHVLMDLARHLEAQGNISGALEAYRQAQALAEGGTAQELALIIADLEARRAAERATVPPGVETADEVEQLFAEGEAAYARGDWARARELLRAVVQRQPAHPRAGAMLCEVEKHLAQQKPRRAAPWKWAAAILGVLLLAGGAWGLSALSAQRRPTPAAMLPPPTATPAPFVPITPYNASQIVTIWSGRAHDNRVSSVAFSPDGRMLASGSDDTTVRLWTVPEMTLLGTLQGHTGGNVSVAFSPDGATLASGSGNGTVRLWRIPDGTPLRTLEGHTDGMGSVAFSPDGATVAAGAGDGTVWLWRVSDGTLLRTLEGHAGSVWRVAFSPDGTMLASGASDGTVRLWRVAGGVLLRILRGHTDLVFGVAFSPDGTLLASATNVDNVRLWRVSDWSILHILETSPGSGEIAFNPNGTILASSTGSCPIFAQIRGLMPWET